MEKWKKNEIKDRRVNHKIKHIPNVLKRIWMKEWIKEILEEMIPIENIFLQIFKDCYSAKTKRYMWFLPWRKHHGCQVNIPGLKRFSIKSRGRMKQNKKKTDNILLQKLKRECSFWIRKDKNLFFFNSCCLFTAID